MRLDVRLKHFEVHLSRAGVVNQLSKERPATDRNNVFRKMLAGSIE